MALGRAIGSSSCRTVRDAFSGMAQHPRLGLEPRHVGGYRRVPHFFSSAVPAPAGMVMNCADRDALEQFHNCSVAESLRHALEEFEIKRRAIPNISNYFVAAAVLGTSGRVYFGVNVELTGHPLSSTVHAEQFAVANAALHGETALTHLVVNAPPCGHCRQFMNELPDAGSLAVHVIKEDGTLEEGSMADLLPKDFGPQHLGIDCRLLPLRDTHTLTLPPQIPALRDIAAEALRAANRAYAPYTNCPAGVAIKLRDGRLFGGFNIESCAHNPSLGPLQVAIVNAISQGALTELDQISEIALVELARGKASFSRSTYFGNKRVHLMHALRS